LKTRAFEEDKKKALVIAELEPEAQRKLEELTKQLGSEGVKLQGKRPSGLKAAMHYITAEGRGLNPTIRQMAELYECTDTTVSNNVKLLKQLMQQGLNSLT